MRGLLPVPPCPLQDCLPAAFPTPAFPPTWRISAETSLTEVQTPVSGFHSRTLDSSRSRMGEG